MSDPLTVAVLGNHRASYTTESELVWTFEHLGHRVLRFQEDEYPTDSILRSCHESGVKLLVYVHTHGWKSPGTLSLPDVFNELQAAGVTTVSFHLDLYFGLKSREPYIGKHPLWRTQFVFTADGGHDRDFRDRGVNHYWLPPAVVERGCYHGVRRQELAADVIFVGCKHYHDEYPQREQLVSWLERAYGSRFRRINGDTTGVYREQRLNDLYASARVCVGDSCFANRPGGVPFYFSDRVPETMGRGGFLIHPAVEGLNWPGLPTYIPGDFGELKEQIDYYLAHEDDRLSAVEAGSKHVREHETYTNRVRTILQTVGLAVPAGVA